MDMRDELLKDIEQDKETKKAYHKEWYSDPDNRERKLRKQKEWEAANPNRRKNGISREQRVANWKRKKTKLVALLGDSCADCGKSFPLSVYNFHHIDPTTKEKAMNFGWSWERLVLETEKCVLLCGNCHMIRHHEERENV